MRKYIEILHQVSNQMLDVDEEEKIYHIISDAIKKILPGTFFIVNKLQPDDMCFRIIESSGFDNYFERVTNMIGKHPFTIDFPFENLTEPQVESFEKRKIHHFPNGIYDLTQGAINKHICKTIEKLLGICDVCAMGFCVEKKFYGGINLFVSSSTIKAGGMNEEVEMTIETIANQASAIIEKLREQAIVKENEAKLLELNNTKDKFFSIIAHDLKSPFNSILGFADLLSENFNDYTNEEKIHQIELLRNSSHNAFELLENLLEWSKIQLGHTFIKKETISLRLLVDDSIKPFINNAVQKKISVENSIDHNILIHTSINSVKAIIRNLFVNAVKFTNHEGQVTFNAKQTDNNTELSISDTGVGMSSEKIDKLFRINEDITTNGTNNEKGTGLGLVLCKEHINEINGKIEIESELGKGTTFRIEIPVLNEENCY